MSFRTPEFIRKQQTLPDYNRTQEELDVLPDDYVIGGSLTVTLGDVLVNPIMASIQGKRVTKPESTNIRDMAWTAIKQNSTTFYIYLDRFGFWFVDTVAPITVDERYGTYNPRTFTRFIAEVYVNSAGFYTTTEIVGIQIIGYSGDGTNEEPKEGDRRVYIDDDEIGFEIYSGGSWSTYNSIKLGGADSNGLFYPFIQGRGIVSPLASEISRARELPDSATKIFSLDNNSEDQDGTDPFTTKTNIVYDAGTKKFGTHSLSATDETRSELRTNADYWTLGESQTLSGWYYITDPETAANAEAQIRLFDAAADNSVELRVYPTVEGGVTVLFKLTRSTVTWLHQLDNVTTLDAWHFISGGFDSENNTTYIVVDDVIHSKDIEESGTWGAGTGWFSIRATHNLFADNLENYVDEAFITPDTYIPPATMVNYYNENNTWDSTQSASDMIIKPATGGRVIAEEGLTSSGPQTISDTTQSTDKDTGALIIEGGVGIEKDVYIGGTTNALDGVTIPVLHVQDQKAAGAAGGGFTAGALQTRILNTEVTNTITGASLASNQITLPAGTYKITAYAPAFFVAGHQAVLYNTSDAAVEIAGSSEFTSAVAGKGEVNSSSRITGLFTIAAQKVFEIQHQCQTTKASNGFGEDGTLVVAVITVYTDVFIEKIA